MHLLWLLEDLNQTEPYSKKHITQQMTLEHSKNLATQGLDSVKSLRITLFKPVRPMLAERVATTMDALNRMNGRGFAEYKLDGERIQVHKGPENVELFTRRLDKITHHFPDLVESVRTLQC